jgi:hypothetical protein
MSHKRNIEGLRRFKEEKTKEIESKIDKAIRELSLNGKTINFLSVANLSGVTKATLYRKPNIRKRIEDLRQREIENRVKIEKTDKSKDLIIFAKDKKIKELKYEKRQLKDEIQKLKSIIYQETV